MRTPSTQNTAGSRLAAFGFLLLAAIGWGVAWPVTKHLLTELPPLSMRGAAGVIGAAALALLALARGESLRVPRHLWLQLIVISILSVGIWAGLGAVSLKWLNAGEAVLLGAFGPVFTSLLAWPLLGERVSLVRACALPMAIASLAVLFGVETFDVSVAKLPGVAVIVGAAFLMAIGTILTKRFVFPMPAIALSVWQIGCGCAAVAIVGLLTEQPHFFALSKTGWLLFAYMTLMQFCVCYACWFAALRRLPASTAAIGTLLTPVVGVLVSAAALHEPLGAREIAALALTLGSVVLAARS